VSGDSESNDGRRSSANSEASHDALGDTHLGRSLKELIKEIGKEKDAAQKGLAPGKTSAAEIQDAESYDLTESRFDQDLEVVVSAQRGATTEDPTAARARGGSSQKKKVAKSADPASGDTDPEVSEAMSGLEAILQQFAAAERRRAEQQLAEWKEQLKKATMIVIKKQVDTARARWMQGQGANQAKMAEQYRKLKALADKVAKQKAQIQKAKQELEQKLEVADKLHNEFDEIRNVLDGQIGAIDALDEGDGPSES
jgi:vacuolar-type H+-ATPase subunit I/STV1